MKSFRTKTDIILIVIITTAFGFPIYQSIIHKKVINCILPSLILLLLFYFFSTLRYVIENEYLIIKTKFYIFNKIKISEIKSIEKTNDLTSAPALSIERLSIKFGKHDEVLLSPKDKQGFINELLNVKASIEIL